MCVCACVCVQLPSPAMLSAALMVFFPKLHGVYMDADITYDLTQHPSPKFAFGVQQSIGACVSE